MLNRNIFMLFCIMCLINTIFAFQTCDVDFNDDDKRFIDEFNSEQFWMTEEGDFVFVQDPMQFNGKTYSRNSVSTDLGKSGLKFEDDLGNTKVVFGDDGVISYARYAVGDNLEGGCSDDGWRNDLNNPNNPIPSGWYCNVDGVNRENRDYYCQVVGSPKAGNCKYTVTSTDNCVVRPSVKYDTNPLVKSSLRDYVNCQANGANVEEGCAYKETDYDYCSSGWTLQELVGGSSGVASSAIDCNSYSGALYCSGLNVYKTIFGCGGGTCNDGAQPDTFQQSCNFATYYTCSGNSAVTHTPKCSSGSCGENTGSSNCGSTYCYSGHNEACNPHNCNPYSCNPHDCNPYSCNGIYDPITMSWSYDTCYNTCYDTCYNTCYDTCFVCDTYNVRGCSGGSCYSYLS